MSNSEHYLKVVKWSEEDQCYVGTAPDLFYGGYHGDNEAAVYGELGQIVDEWLEIAKQDGKPLPPPTDGPEIPERIILRNKVVRMSDFLSFYDLAERLGVGYDTVRRTIARNGNDLGITVEKKRLQRVRAL